MKIAFGTDDVTPVTRDLVASLTELGHEVSVYGDGLRWADVGLAVGSAVAGGQADAGIVMCFTGTGVSIAANKVPGVRAALCGDPETARDARRWNDANVLALALRTLTADLGLDIVEAFLASFPDGTEADQIAQLP
jgi:ribose 5-phosphate isomerase B